MLNVQFLAEALKELDRSVHNLTRAEPKLFEMFLLHDDVIKWKHFPRYWLTVREIDRWIPLTMASHAELWCFLWSAPEQTIEQTIEPLVIWDAIELIMTSLQCGVHVRSTSVNVKNTTHLDGVDQGTSQLWYTWWRHQMGTISASLALCAGNSPAPGEFPAQRPVMRSFDIFFDLRQKKTVE